MAKVGRVHLALIGSVAAVMAGVSYFSFGETNVAHFTNATGILTMNQCMECHSKGSMKPITICLDDHCIYTNSHSVMHQYPPPGKEQKYAPVSVIEKAGCILEQGRVTCLSCHDLTKPAPHLIREGDELCYICHIYLKP